MRVRQLIQKGCVLFFILFYWGLAVANTQKVVTLGHKKIVFDQGQISVYKDPSESLTLEDAIALNAQGKFLPTRDAISEGYIRSAVWGYTKISRPEEASSVWGISITPSYQDQVDIFVLQKGELIEHLAAGDQV
ncbi:MAG: 7TM-DISM domain-containing protein, partial [Marinobacterium sp.]